MYYVYILESKLDSSHYVGMTKNLKRRLQEHNSGNSKYCSSKKPYEIIWYGAFRDKTKALDFEKYLKQGSGFAFRNKRLV